MAVICPSIDTGSNPVLFLFTFIFLKEVFKMEQRYCETCNHNDCGLCDYHEILVIDEDDACDNYVSKLKEDMR